MKSCALELARVVGVGVVVGLRGGGADCHTSRSIDSGDSVSSLE